MEKSNQKAAPEDTAFRHIVLFVSKRVLHRNIILLLLNPPPRTNAATHIPNTVSPADSRKCCTCRQAVPAAVQADLESEMFL